jgi:surface protein
MRLEKGMIKGVKLGREEVVGLKLNGTYLFETTGPSYWNIYIIQIPPGVTVQTKVQDYDNASWRNENNYTPYVDWGVGDPITDSSGAKIFAKIYNNSASRGPWTIKIKTTCELLTNRMSDVDFPGDYIKDISSIRSDYIDGSSLFAGFSGIKTIREPVLERLNTKVFTNMTSMFEGCSSMEKLNLASFNTSNVETMGSMFRNCSSLISLDLSDFDTSKVWDVDSMFSNCISLTELNLSNFNLDSVNTSGYGMNGFLRNCTSLHTLRLDNCSYDTIKKILNGSYFANGTYIASSNFPTGDIGKTRYIYCKKENVGDLEEPYGWKFNFNIGIEEPEIPDVPEEPEEPEIPLYQKDQFKGRTDITEVVTMVNNTNSNLGYMFDGCTNLVSVNTQDWNVDNASYTEGMFRNCSSIVNIDLSTVRCESGAYSVGAMDYMFAGCTSLETLDLRNFYISYADVEEDYITRNMFDGCTSLRTLYLNNCGAFTINQIIKRLPYGKDWGGVIYIKQYNQNDEYREIYNVAPYGWRFEYVD